MPLTDDPHVKAVRTSIRYGAPSPCQAYVLVVETDLVLVPSLPGYDPRAVQSVVEAAVDEAHRLDLQGVDIVSVGAPPT